MNVNEINKSLVMELQDKAESLENELSKVRSEIERLNKVISNEKLKSNDSAKEKFLEGIAEIIEANEGVYEKCKHNVAEIERLMELDREDKRKRNASYFECFSTTYHADGRVTNFRKKYEILFDRGDYYYYYKANDKGEILMMDKKSMGQPMYMENGDLVVWFNRMVD